MVKKWKQNGKNIDGESVSLTSYGKTIAIGAHFNSDKNEYGSDHIGVYELTECKIDKI